ncbi:glutathione-dependent disulfide-bond oxidoreductase, partial [Altererythrobacter sp.]|nr:glutathione-dependent disulfide-bond oxidoreductase [Altererythrobacter sp.]
MTTYTPPEVWTNDSENGGKFANINSPVSGAREQKDLPVGEHPYQLYSLATPNGVKANMIFEELIEAGHDLDYDAWIVNIGVGEQFTSGFV